MVLNIRLSICSASRCGECFVKFKIITKLMSCKSLFANIERMILKSYCLVEFISELIVQQHFSFQLINEHKFGLKNSPYIIYSLKVMPFAMILSNKRFKRWQSWKKKSFWMSLTLRSIKNAEALIKKLLTIKKFNIKLIVKVNLKKKRTLFVH